MIRDYAVKVPSPDHRDRTPLKKAVAGLLGDRFQGSARYLYSAEPRAPLSDWFRLRLLDGDLPRSGQMVAIPVELPQPSAGDNVVIQGWIALKAKNFHGDHAASEGGHVVYGKLAAMQDRFSGAVNIEECRVDRPFHVAEIKRGRQTFHRPYGHILIRGQVVNPRATAALLASGIGAAKAYGFGLLDLQIEKEKEQ